MLTRADQLARLRVACTTGQLPRDLGSWLLDELDPSSARAAARARDLQRAAVATGASTRYARAHELAAIVAMFTTYPGLVAAAWFPEGTAEAIVQRLMRTGTVPK